MTDPAIVFAVAIAVTAVFRMLHFFHLKWKQVAISETADYGHIARLEHELMIAGHEDACRLCARDTERLIRDGEIEKAKALGAKAEKVDYIEACSNLEAARRPSNVVPGAHWLDTNTGTLRIMNPQYEWIEVSGFGEESRSWIRGRRHE